MNSLSKRVTDLVSRMHIQEKVAQMFSVWLKIGEDGSIALKQTSFGESGEMELDPFELIKNGVGQITRPLGTNTTSAKKCVQGLNRLQKFLVEETRLGIPALPHEECLAGLMGKGATLFPAAINYGALWDEELMEKIAGIIGKELYSVGSRQGLAPVLDVSRDARWGRTEETMGEDPYLAGCMGLAYTRGLQGPDRRILATLKHFAGHSFCEGGRNHAPVRIGERELYDTFLLPFEMVVRSVDVGSVLPAYHDIDGVPLHASGKYLTGILRNTWGFQGLIVADYQGVSQLHTDHRIAGDPAEAAAISVRAGLDIELPGFDCFYKGLEEALKRGILEVGEIDAAVKRIITEKFRLGLFDKPFTEEGSIELNTEEHRSAAYEAAVKSAVLLKNNGVLPLGNNGKVALIGPLADDGLGMLGGYSFPVHIIAAGLSEEHEKKNRIKTLKDVLSERLGERLSFARGCEVLKERPKDAPVFPGDVEVDRQEQESPVSYDTGGIKEAVEIARKSDLIIAAVGDLAGLFLTGTVGEGSDVTSLRLPGVQQDLLNALAELEKPLIVLIFNGRPYHLEDIFRKADAILDAWLPGQEGGTALADILMGDANPGGKLPVSIPKSAGAMPYFYNHKLKSPGTPIQPDFGAEYPFGYGLSYTDFSFGNFSIESHEVPTDGNIRLAFTLTNTGNMTGDEVVQLYTRDLYASMVRPVRELKGFRRVSLLPGQTARIEIEIPSDVLSFTGADFARIIEPGEIEIMLGTSSKDIIFREVVRLTGKEKRLEGSWRMRSTFSVDLAAPV